ncbi:MAG TPA: YbhB/YbcL family Raf kinase inhibitor-like protein [Candidatus Saccharimonadales bacterium]|nr:YbhB/YbcL family Raf kinase inhibitor-like protein [Candidatus Saccharimonadales bacterium]
MPQYKLVGAMELNSPAFANNTAIPDAYTCKGAGISPPLTISGIPTGTQSLALVVIDPDAPTGEYTHWSLWNISGTTSVLKENSVPTGAIQGQNSANSTGYTPPCPPAGTHRYFFKVYALNRQLTLEEGARPYAFQASLEGHVLAKAELIGLVTAK